MLEFFQKRRAKLQTILARRGLGPILVTKPVNIYYLTGYHPPEGEREVFLLIDKAKVVALVSPLATTEDFSREKIEFELWSRELGLSKFIQCHTHNLKRLDIEADNLTWAEAVRIKELGLELSNVSDVFLELRQIKDRWEQRLLTQIGSITARTFDQVGDQIVPGVSESEVARLLRNNLEQLGASGAAEHFAPIVAFGPNSATAHHQSGLTTLKTDQVVLVDFGGQLDGYASDMTRTFCVGQEPPEYAQIRQLVHEAYNLGLKELVVGNKASAVDLAIRQVFRQAGLEECYIHTAGHGLGLEIHEPPSLYFQADHVLKSGMVISLEPGLYLPGKFGYRHENTYLLTTKGPRLLTISSYG